MRKAAIFALSPRWAQAILDGSKTVEVRRRPIGIEGGCLAVLYATAPLRHVLGSCCVDAVHRGPAAQMWRRFGSRTGLTKIAFLEYLEGSEATCIELSDPRTIAPIPLAFPPPQSWMHLQRDCKDHLQLLDALAHGTRAEEALEK